jgi:hypothetical protein
MTEKTTITLTPIGIIHSPHLTGVGTPIQPTYAKQCEGQVIVLQGHLAQIPCPPSTLPETPRSPRS